MTRLETLRQLDAFIHAEIEAELGPMLDGGADNPLVVAVSDLYDVQPDLVLAGGRGHRVTKVRHCLAWLLRRKGMSMPEVAHVLGYTDAGTAKYACDRVDADTGVKALLRGLEVEE